MSHDDFAFEPIPGLPARPPKGETILWQGAPDWRLLAMSALHVRKVFVYFGLLAVWRVASALLEGDVTPALPMSVSVLAGMSLVAAAILSLIAYGLARSTVYTITDRRVVMRFGMALPMTVNLPFRQIDGVSLKSEADGRGDICLKLAEKGFSYLVMWPHVRPWRFSQPEPMLRAIPDAAHVAKILAEAFARQEPAKVERPFVQQPVGASARPTLVAAE